MTTPFDGTYAGKTVLVTGHTGFKGSWLALWLKALGANVVGYSLDPPTTPSMYAALALDGELDESVHGDVNDIDALRRCIDRHQPDLIFHLAAQSLVRASYADPLETFRTNVIGTATVLEAARTSRRVRGCVIATSDKCYENREWPHAYRESDALGGHDPYSASKGAAEIAAAAWRQSFPDSCRVASVRAGNVVGGGDWAADRIVPDCIRALSSGEPVLVRNPHAVRPWQHVLEPLSGYLVVGARLLSDDADAAAQPWNFGPTTSEAAPVSDLVQLVVDHWGEGTWTTPSDLPPQPHEANLLMLDVTKASRLLAWRPALDLGAAIAMTVEWYRAAADGQDAGRPADRDRLLDLTIRQIDSYTTRAHSAGLAWAQLAPAMAATTGAHR